jgi:hypothetical protein
MEQPAIFAGGKHLPGCDHPFYEVGKALDRRGRTIFPYFCVSCRAVQNHYVPRDLAESLERAGQHLPRVHTAAEIEAMTQGTLDFGNACEVCGDLAEIELHHWGPRALFGDAADLWPTSYLCRSCHVIWHATIATAARRHAN